MRRRPKRIPCIAPSKDRRLFAGIFWGAMLAGECRAQIAENTPQTGVFFIPAVLPDPLRQHRSGLEICLTLYIDFQMPSRYYI